MFTVCRTSYTDNDLHHLYDTCDLQRLYNIVASEAEYVVVVICDSVWVKWIVRLQNIRVVCIVLLQTLLCPREIPVERRAVRQFHCWRRALHIVTDHFNPSSRSLFHPQLFSPCALLFTFGKQENNNFPMLENKLFHPFYLRKTIALGIFVLIQWRQCFCLSTFLKYFNLQV